MPAPMKVLVADAFEESGLAGLRAVGCDVAYDGKLKDDALRDAIARTRPEILIVRGTKVTADMIAACDELALIIRAGAGYNTIDVAAASKRGIAVSNCPGKNAIAVAELTLGLILALDRRIPDNVRDLAAGRWNKKLYSEARGLKGRVLGVIGTGEIGQAVIRRALSFEMDVVAWSRSLTDEFAAELGVTRCACVADVADRCDILTVHVAAAPQTRGLLSADVLNRLKPGSYVINTARADVLDYAALARVVRENGVRVGLDVFPDEPAVGEAEFHAEILRTGGVIYGTHHIGASTEQAQQAIADETVRIARVYAQTGEVENCVNLQARAPAACQMVVRHYDKVGVLAHVLDLIRRADISVKDMKNTIYQGSHAAVAVLRLDKLPPAEVVAAINAMSDMIIKVDVKPVE